MRHGGLGTDNPTLELVSRAFSITRFHARDTLEKNTVAAHSFGVAWFCWMLMSGEASAALIMHALAHDLPEAITGDIPSPVKRLPGVGEKMAAMEAAALVEARIFLPELTHEETRTLKIADCLDGLLFCALEARRGNFLRTEYYPFLRDMVKSRDEIRLFNDVIRAYNNSLARDFNSHHYPLIREGQVA